MASTTVLKEIAAERFTGPRAAISLSNIVKTILVIGQRKAIGRASLSKEVGVGEGVTRTIIARLKKKTFLTVTNKGCILSKKGETLYSALSAKLIRIANVEGKELNIGGKYSALLTRNIQFSSHPILDYRDTAIRAGASGAILMTSEKKKLAIPSVTDEAGIYAPRLANDLRNKLDPKDGDMIIVCGAPTYRDAENAAIAVALSMVDEKRF
ncbi:MAG TPA: DUF4443 domain-containing protein [Candidatus Bathyarchaeia archaeon]|nr:MAG: hypothetical protein A3K70_01055 [Candidatus Bathyarchaeota archaeon RBG_16_48_13]HJX23687.1 DUF4443 domain-containing protein [Candidatus Bathyarchaeia archaeon]